MSKKQYLIKISDLDRIRVELEIAKGKVENFIVQLETLFAGKWRHVVRYNYSHSFPHRDLIFIDGKKSKEKIYENNLSKVVNLAIKELKRNWKKYLWRCGYEKK